MFDHFSVDSFNFSAFSIENSWNTVVLEGGKERDEINWIKKSKQKCQTQNVQTIECNLLSGA